MSNVARNARNRMDGADLLRSLRRSEARAVFLDPQYRGLLDRMRYGNEGRGRERRRATLPQMTDDAIGCFVEESARLLSPSGHLFLWVDKFTLGTGGHLRLVDRGPKLAIVDLIHWNKIRAGMGRRARCTSEYVVVVQKWPLLAKGVWTDHYLLDSWVEGADRSLHPHAKPYQLIERLIRATTRRGDLVVDPCAGSYVVLEACRATGREFVGCDLAKENPL
jgi:site-specific DNA-methyltransferase (adenine-specific)